MLKRAPIRAVFLGYVGWAAGNFDPSKYCALNLSLMRVLIFRGVYLSGYVLSASIPSACLTYSLMFV